MRFSSLNLCWLAAATFLLTLFSGCAHYQMGAANNPPFSTIYVAPAKTSAIIPQAQTVLTEQVRTALAQAGFKLASEDYADVLLNLTLSDTAIQPAATASNDSGLGASYDVQLLVTYSLERQGGKALFSNRTASARQTVFAADGFSQAKTQAVPVITRRLATKIADDVASTW